MTALDYFLYDNRTWSPRWGRDWGLKASTGALADRADLKADFERYCGALAGDQGRLGGFGEAIGGVRTRSGGGYLLCVTLESVDPFGRPSWASFGLWCPDPETLKQVLTACDPIGSTRVLLGSEALPAAIELRPAHSAAPLRRWCPAAKPAFYRFDPRDSVREVTSLLLAAAQQGRALPSVLGITAASRLSAVAEKGFDLVYCHPMDQRAERALERLASGQIPDEEPSLPTHAPVKLARRPERRVPHWLEWVVAAILAVGIGSTAVFVLVTGERRAAPPAAEAPSAGGEKAMDAGDAAGSRAATPDEQSTEAVLREVGELVNEFKKLQDLEQSPGFQAARDIEVLPEHRSHRERVLAAYAALEEIHGRLTGSYIDYYFNDEVGKKVAAATKLQKIAAALAEVPLDDANCRVLAYAFGSEYQDKRSILRSWCEALERFQETSQSLPEPGKAAAGG